MDVYSKIQRTLTILWACCLILGLGVGGDAAAQVNVGVQGVVRTPEGRPVSGVEIFLLETLEAVVTDDEGAFHLRTAHRGPATLVVHGPGWAEARISVALPVEAPIALVVRPAIVALPPLVVEVGRYAAGGDHTAALTSLDVVSTPGAHADVLQAIRTMPGVQAIGDGAALYVRGADPTETRVLLNGAPLLAPYRFEASSMAFGLLDPFQLSSIEFSSGGFGARHGNSVGGLLELETLGLPEQPVLNATISMAGMSGHGAFRLTEAMGVRGTVNRSSTEFLFRLNGIRADVVRAPESRNVSAGGAWAYRPGGEIKVHAMDEWNRFSVLADRHSHSGTFAGDDGSRHVIVSMVDAAGSNVIRASTSYSTRGEEQSFGAFRLSRDERLGHARIELSRSVARDAVLRAGGSMEMHRALLAGSYPADGDARPGARTRVFESRIDDVRPSAFAELTLRLARQLEVTTGARVDASDLVRRPYIAPRLNAAIELADGAFLTMGLGRYTQAPHPLLFAADTGGAQGPVEAVHGVVGFVLEREQALLRFEIYDRSSAGISALDRDYTLKREGRASTRGADVFARVSGSSGLEARASYSFTHAVRTDPDTDIQAPSPLAVRHGVVMIVDRTWESWRLGGSLRHASGRPWTPVADASYDTGSARWEPVYAAPFSAELPSYNRVDLSAQFLQRLRRDDLIVIFASVTNVLGQKNVTGYSYSSDYQVRTPLEATIRRTFFAGISLTF